MALEHIVYLKALRLCPSEQAPQPLFRTMLSCHSTSATRHHVWMPTVAGHLLAQLCPPVNRCFPELHRPEVWQRMIAEGTCCRGRVRMGTSTTREGDIDPRAHAVIRQYIAKRIRAYLLLMLGTLDQYHELHLVSPRKVTYLWRHSTPEALPKSQLSACTDSRIGIPLSSPSAQSIKTSCLASIPSSYPATGIEDGMGSLSQWGRPVTGT